MFHPHKLPLACFPRRVRPGPFLFASVEGCESKPSELVPVEHKVLEAGFDGEADSEDEGIAVAGG